MMYKILRYYDTAAHGTNEYTQQKNLIKQSKNQNQIKLTFNNNNNIGQI